jgi:CMP/dCMP kinase
LKSLQKLSVNAIPVIAIDGPSASGKGTVAQLVADKLGFHYLDSGALYRIVALAAQQQNMAWDNGDALGKLAESLNIAFKNGEIYLGKNKITDEVRSDEISRGASEVAIHPQVRQALFDLQHSFRKMPGLVADGRDMASVVFADAALKIFLTASVEIRADRRYKQPITNKLATSYGKVLLDLQARDYRDSQRRASPLAQTPDAILLDTSYRSINDAVEFVLAEYKKKLQNIA